ncbi:hypothetical protein [Oerskovia flava]|uniref:hypothetical protein n=1 Tax=Oerskovia flava TaxID=2986422 RepID=UPI00223F4DD6|nr:hypothetical protein [Oerskovia sp. JB1-3-2]
MSAPERVERTMRCPHGDGRAVARVVVRDGARFLDVVGGRFELGAQRRAWLADQRRTADRTLELPDHPLLAVHRVVAERISRSTEADLDDMVYPESHPIPSDLDILLRDNGNDPMKHPAACPRCHALLWIAVRPRGDAWNVVLSS